VAALTASTGHPSTHANVDAIASTVHAALTVSQATEHLSASTGRPQLDCYFPLFARLVTKTSEQGKDLRALIRRLLRASGHLGMEPAVLACLNDESRRASNNRCSRRKNALKTGNVASLALMNRAFGVLEACELNGCRQRELKESLHGFVTAYKTDNGHHHADNDCQQATDMAKPQLGLDELGSVGAAARPSDLSASLLTDLDAANLSRSSFGDNPVDGLSPATYRDDAIVDSEMYRDLGPADLRVPLMAPRDGNGIALSLALALPGLSARQTVFDCPTPYKLSQPVHAIDLLPPTSNLNTTPADNVLAALDSAVGRWGMVVDDDATGMEEMLGLSLDNMLTEVRPRWELRGQSLLPELTADEVNEAIAALELPSLASSDGQGQLQGLASGTLRGGLRANSRELLSTQLPAISMASDGRQLPPLPSAIPTDADLTSTTSSSTRTRTLSAKRSACDRFEPVDRCIRHRGQETDVLATSESALEQLSEQDVTEIAAIIINSSSNGNVGSSAPTVDMTLDRWPASTENIYLQDSELLGDAWLMLDAPES